MRFKGEFVDTWLVILQIMVNQTFIFGFTYLNTEVNSVGILKFINGPGLQ